jgi:molybdopterin synthase catalytic subunit
MRSAVVSSPIDVAALLAEVADPRNGAAVLFIGTVREQNEGREVTGIDYAAYDAMATSELQCIVRECAARFSTEHVVAEHRIGHLDLGEISVALAVAHPHRAEAYEASRFVIEEIKRRVPIWKREEYVDGTREWVGQVRETGTGKRETPKASSDDTSIEGSDVSGFQFPVSRS